MLLTGDLYVQKTLCCLYFSAKSKQNPLYANLRLSIRPKKFFGVFSSLLLPTIGPGEKKNIYDSTASEIVGLQNT